MSELISFETSKTINNKNLSFVLSIPKPDKAIVKEYSDRFHNQSQTNNILIHNYEKALDSKISDYEVAEKILTDLFQENEHYKRNTDLDIITTKVVLLNSFYSTRIDNDMLIPLARQIMATRMDNKLIDYSTDNKPVANCDLVNAIAYCRTPINNWEDKIDNRYSFASKYCSWHRPDLYPIVDSYAKGLLIYLLDINLNDEEDEREIHFPYNFPKGSQKKFSAKNKILSDYHDYYKAYMMFIEKYKLQDQKLKAIDEYLWTLAREPLKDENCRVWYQEKEYDFSVYQEITKLKKAGDKKSITTIADLVKAESEYPDNICKVLEEKYPSFEAICKECEKNGIDWIIQKINRK